MNQVYQPTLKINDLGRDPMRDLDKMATMPKNAATQRPFNGQSHLETYSTLILYMATGHPLVDTATPCGSWTEALSILRNTHLSPWHITSFSNPYVCSAGTWVATNQIK